MESTGSRETLSTSCQFKISVYYPILDAMLSELRYRFEDKNLEHMRAIQACNPKSKNFLEPTILTEFGEFYHLNTTTLSMESLLAKRTLNGKDLSTISDVLQELSSLLETAFPSLGKLLQIVVSTAHCERSFSALKRIKNYLRSTMTEQRLTNLAILSIERELSKVLSLDEVVDRFANKDKNRRIILN